MATPHGGPPAVTAATAHKALVSVGLLVVALIGAVIVAGDSPSAAKIILLVLVGVVLIRGITSGSILGGLGNYPWTP